MLQITAQDVEAPESGVSSTAQPLGRRARKAVPLVADGLSLIVALAVATAVVQTVRPGIDSSVVLAVCSRSYR